MKGPWGLGKNREGGGHSSRVRGMGPAQSICQVSICWLSHVGSSAQQAMQVARVVRYAGHSLQEPSCMLT